MSAVLDKDTEEVIMAQHKSWCRLIDRETIEAQQARRRRDRSKFVAAKQVAKVPQVSPTLATRQSPRNARLFLTSTSNGQSSSSKSAPNFGGKKPGEATSEFDDSFFIEDQKPMINKKKSGEESPSKLDMLPSGVIKRERLVTVTPTCSFAVPPVTTEFDQIPSALARFFEKEKNILG